VVAESADGWNTFFAPLAEYQHKLDVLAAHCAAVGRDPRDIRKSLVVQAVVAKTQAEIDERLLALSRARGVSPEALRARAVIGTPEQCVEQLQPYVAAGVHDIIIGSRPPADYGTLELVAGEIAPALRRLTGMAPGPGQRA
jgi:alkanesulfonate monooxygenase SsuD/methylene tetrahydromethanopterin reductase-like flavin-dependent oxidoreductase (luciferase family)